MTCEHMDFQANVEVNRLVKEGTGELEGLSVDVRAVCVACNEPVIFHGQGITVGMLSDRPCISVDGAELRIPARMQSHDPHFGLGLPGFSARIREGDFSTGN
jgi:hypothetical protein